MSKFENLAVLKLSQVAEYLQVSKQTIYNYVKNGTLPYFRANGSGQYRFKKADIDKTISGSRKTNRADR